MRGRFGLLIALAFAISVVFTPSTFAQATVATAQLNGTITDPTGAAVANAMVTVKNTATNVSHTTKSNASGLYVVTNLEPGNYELSVSSSGFAAFTQTAIRLTVGESATVNVELRLASQGARVVVTTAAPVIEPTRTEVSQVIDTQQISALPISNRVFTDFALLTPGVATSRTSLGATFTEFETTQISFGGMRSFSNEITVDGADFVNSASGIQRSTPPQSSVQEFRVVNNSFGAEYGRALGGIVNIVTKSGTNNLHGSLYEYFQNKATDARGALQTAGLPDQFRENQFGGTLGGPIKKDKTFFFLNYEGKRRAESPTYPPDLVNNILTIDQAKALMGLAPEGCTLAGLGACVPGFANDPNNITQTQASNYLNGFLKTYNDDAGFARVDDQVNSNNHVAIRYNVRDVRASGELVGNTLDGGGIGVPSGGRDLFIRDQSVVATWSDLISPSIVNSFLAQYARRHYNFPGMTGQPDFSLLNDLELGHNFGTNDRLYETRGEVSDSVSWIKGNHIAKFGFDGNYLSSLENFPGFTPVRSLVPGGVPCLVNFAEYYNSLQGTPEPTNGTLDGLAPECAVAQDNGVSFMYAGVPLPTDANACVPTTLPGGCTPTVTSAANALDTTTWANAYPPQFFNRYSRVIDHGYWGAYAQDQWRITPRLTLNYGLRWDFESGLGAFVRNDFNEWQPRIGLAYSPDDKTVFRAGFGIFFGRQNLTFFFVPNTQKIVAGYQCDNHPTPFIVNVCNGAGIQPQQFPDIMANLGQATQGYQLFAFPGGPEPTAQAALHVAQVIQTGGYDTFTNTGMAGGTIAMAGTCFTTGACGIGNGGMDRNARAPYAEQASAEIDRELGKGFAINVSYLFVGAHKLVRGNNINVPCPVGTQWPAAQLAANNGPTDPLPEWSQGWLLASGNSAPASCDSGTPTLGTGAIAGLGPFFAGPLGSGLQTVSAGLEDYNNNVANAVYHGGTVTLLEKSKYFNLTANYTYSHTIDNGNFTTFINLPVNQFNYRAAEANSNQDLRHRFVANFVATAPTHGWYRNFQFSSIITLQSGRPFTIFYGAPALNDVAAGATDRVGGTGVPGYHCTLTSNCQTMIPRNTYIGDPLYSWDFRLARFFQLRENLKLELAVSAFNVLNRPNVDEVTPIYGSPVFCGPIPHHYNDAASRAIQSGSETCPAGQIGLGPVGSLALTPIATTFPTSAGAALFIPTHPNTSFGLPRTMLNPRRFQFSAEFTF